MDARSGLTIWAARARRGLRRSPGEILRRLLFEAKAYADRSHGVPSARFSDAAFAGLFGAADLQALWEALRGRPYPATSEPRDAAALEKILPGEAARVRAAAASARALSVDLLGSGPIKLGTAPRDIEWHVDSKSGLRWPIAHFRSIDLNDLGRPSDVKVPWELSRLQWLIPIGQDYLLSGDEEHAAFVRAVLESWIIANPYAQGVNWGVAMEPAMRLFTWTWLFHVFAGSAAWRDAKFRGSFVRSIYDHAIFCVRYLEDFGASTNHLIADAAGIAYAGLFLGETPAAREIASFGLQALRRALPRQVGADGVNHEGSIAYHRLVAELVGWTVRYADARGIGGIDDLKAHTVRMAVAVASFVGPDGRVALLGDCDDARVLPFGGQPPDDHSYLPALLGASGTPPSEAARAELWWALGALPPVVAAPRTGAGFAQSGVYAMAGERDHVTIDCGPVGHAHGHNDALSFEAVLDGVRLLTDSGSYCYTSSEEERNRFRSAAAHNAPIVDGREPNRLVAGELFRLADEARVRMVEWRTGDDDDRFVGVRASGGVTVTRTICLDKRRHVLSLRDTFEGGGAHKVVVPLHFAAGTILERVSDTSWRVRLGGRLFAVSIDAPEWTARTAISSESRRYGVKRERPVLELARDGALAPLSVTIAPD